MLLFGVFIFLFFYFFACFPEEGSISLRFLSSGGAALSGSLRRNSGFIGSRKWSQVPPFGFTGGKGIEMGEGVCVGGRFGGGGLLAGEQAFSECHLPTVA